MLNHWPTQAGLNGYFGNPDADGDGLPDMLWETHALTRIVPPYPMVLAWDVSKRVPYIRCHSKVAASLLAVLHAIADHYGTQEAVEAARMHLFGGCYCFRLMRGGHRLSVHSWGAAIDLDPEHNPFGGKSTMPPVVVDLFKAEGWTWGGDWTSKPDPQHFQAATV